VHEPDLAAAPARHNLQPGERVHGHHVGLGSAHVAQDDAAPCRRVGSHQHKDRLGSRNSSHAAAAGGVPWYMRLYDYAASCNCYKVRLLLAQLRRPYERVPVDIFAGETLTDAFAAINPARTTPVLETGDGRTLPESAAILAYLAAATPMLPDDGFARAEVIRWLVWEQTDVVPAIAGLRFRLLTGRLAPADAEARRRSRLAGEVLRVLDGHLSQRDFLVAGR
jgi:glutathione S-transferase